MIINEGRPVLTTINPFKNPKNITINNVSNAAEVIEKCAWTVNKVIAILEKPIIEPMDKSNSPLIINKVTPMASMPISDETCKYYFVPETDKKALWPKIEKKIHTKTNPANAPLSGLVMIFFKYVI